MSKQELIKSESEIQPKEKWKAALALGLTLLIGGAYFLYKYKTRHPDEIRIA